MRLAYAARVVELRTPLVRQLGIEYPILNAGMARAAGPELAAAVSNAGGLGVLGASLPPDRIQKVIRDTRALTNRPFGINIIIDDRGSTEDDRRELHEMVSTGIAERPAVLVLFWGDPAPYVAEAHGSAVKVFIQIGSVDEAKAAVAAGVDAIIVQGVEAGGHVCATRSIWELLPAVVEAVTPVPVLASGGIGDAAGIRRALQLGAEGVSLGTRFMASDEARIHPAYKRRVIEASAADTVLLDDLFDVGWPDAPHRVLRNKAVAEWEAAGRPRSGLRPGEGTSIGKRLGATGELVDWRRYAVGVAGPEFHGDLEYAPLWAGESCSVVNDIKPAREIVHLLAREAASRL